MKKNLCIQTAFLFSLLVFTMSGMAQTTVVVHADKPGAKIDKAIYGHFAEHLGHCIYGGIYVGENSDIPNMKGFRTDVVTALKDLSVPLVRWPGGCFADTYHWMDGIGPKSERPSIINVHWGGVTENNSFGTHEFLDFCELIGADAYVNLNVGSGTVREAAEWVEYVTSSNESPMTSLRKKNGREKPWNVKYWAVGNETWGCGGNMRPEYYADLYRQYATFMRGPGMYKIASGANVEDYKWTEVMMRDAARWMNGLSLHYYTIPYDWQKKGSATDFDEKVWFSTLNKTLKMDTLVAKHAAIMDRFDPKKRVGLLVDEWGSWYDVEPGTNPGFLFQQNSLRDALIAGINLNIFNNHADRVRMSNIAQMINVLQAVILTKEKEMVLTPTYHVFKMYRVHQDATMLPVDLKCDKYTFGSQSVDAVNCSASVKDGVVSITLCNLDPNKPQQASFELSGFSGTKVSGQVVTAGKINAYNDFGKKEEVTLTDFKNVKINNGKIDATLPSKSVVLIQVRL
ncbi:MAG TPA: alpha-N-arabinofuranosidase [Prolixibacteraceae bacterium]|nr:alpha-N-arabinofuranosidase [Prolixibacteraceae bacterium]